MCEAKREVLVLSPWFVVTGCMGRAQSCIRGGFKTAGKTALPRGSDTAAGFLEKWLMPRAWLRVRRVRGICAMLLMASVNFESAPKQSVEVMIFVGPFQLELSVLFFIFFHLYKIWRNLSGKERERRDLVISTR